MPSWKGGWLEFRKLNFAYGCWHPWVDVIVILYPPSAGNLTEPEQLAEPALSPQPILMLRK
ncbi:hypothetical protein Pan97_51740 [Bremerella volcania]|uniref:Uncharacterized protein n=1 Tax=Bremerella volcania TaxID=2527984 RepID=A0A518CFZ3_9BACT|nr:hypothetical protein Pan97_51740 [Bremerella volcania]